MGTSADESRSLGRGAGASADVDHPESKAVPPLSPAAATPPSSLDAPTRHLFPGRIDLDSTGQDIGANSGTELGLGLGSASGNGAMIEPKRPMSLSVDHIKRLKTDGAATDGSAVSPSKPKPLPEAHQPIGEAGRRDASPNQITAGAPAYMKGASHGGAPASVQDGVSAMPAMATIRRSNSRSHIQIDLLPSSTPGGKPRVGPRRGDPSPGGSSSSGSSSSGSSSSDRAPTGSPGTPRTAPSALSARGTKSTQRAPPSMWADLYGSGPIGPSPSRPHVAAAAALVTPAASPPGR